MGFTHKKLQNCIKKHRDSINHNRVSWCITSLHCERMYVCNAVKPRSLRGNLLMGLAYRTKKIHTQRHGDK